MFEKIAPTVVVIVAITLLGLLVLGAGFHLAAKYGEKLLRRRRSDEQ